MNAVEKFCQRYGITLLKEGFSQHLMVKELTDLDWDTLNREWDEYTAIVRQQYETKKTTESSQKSAK